MRTISYKRGTMFGQAVGCVVLALGGAWAAFSLHGWMQFLGGFLAVTLPFVAIALTVRAMGDCVALRFDVHSVTIKTLFRTVEVDWKQVIDVRREKLRQSSMFGLIKQDIGHYLVIVARDGMFERNYQLDEKLLDWPRDAMSALAEELVAAANGVMQAAPSVQARPRRVDDPLAGSRPSEGFDADAAMARYMATRTAAPSAPTPARASFGRKVVG